MGLRERTSVGLDAHDLLDIAAIGLATFVMAVAILNWAFPLDGAAETSKARTVKRRRGVKRNQASSPSPPGLVRDVMRCTIFAKDDHGKQENDIDGNVNDVYQTLLRLKASLEVVPIREDPTTIALHLKRMSLANRSAFDDVSDLVRLKSAIALCTSSNSNRLNRSTCEMMKEQALEAHHLNIRMGQRVPRRLKPEPKVTSQW